MKTWMMVGAALLGGCMGSESFSGAGGFGATPGGVQDMRLARALIGKGQVPPAAAFLVEGMFSEHDLPLPGATCPRLLCLRARAGVAPLVDGKPAGWIQVGMSSTIDPARYARPAETIIATVDVSGSMGWDNAPSDEHPSAGALARRLLEKIAAQLGPDDRVAIVTYGSDVSVPLELTVGDDAAVAATIAGLTTNGSTNMEAGLRRAYELADEAREEGRPVRIILFTDEQPNVGRTQASDFEAMARAGAEKNIGLTVMGLGLGLGQEIMVGMSHLKSGNAFSLMRFVDIDALMEQDWPWFTIPIAHGLHVALTPAAGLSVLDSYGFPPSDDKAGTTLDVASVFLSKKRGALLLRLGAEDPAALSALSADGVLRYTTPEGQPVEELVHVAKNATALDERGQSFDAPSVGPAVALALLVRSMKEAAEVYSSSLDDALAQMEAADARFTADATALGDADLQPEVELSHALLELMRKNAAQGDLYGQF